MSVEIATDTSLCGICINKHTHVKCKMCNVNLCNTCSKIVNDKYFRNDYIILCMMCELKMISQCRVGCNNTTSCYEQVCINPNYKKCIKCLFKCHIIPYINYNNYCYNCDTVISKYSYFTHKNMCYNCIENPSQRYLRDKLSHYKAKPLIEEIYDIKGIAQIIFDYYYKPRRYFPGEM